MIRSIAAHRTCQTETVAAWYWQSFQSDISGSIEDGVAPGTYGIGMTVLRRLGHQSDCHRVSCDRWTSNGR